MSRETDFHNLIEQQNLEEKEAAWHRLESKLSEQQELREGKATASPKKRRSPKFMKVLSACASFAVISIIGLGVGLGIGLNPDKGGADDTLDNDPPEQTLPVDPPEEPPILYIRYCGVKDCEMVSSEFTLKEYAENYQIKLLYLDWYEKTEDYNNSLYKLKENGDIVCFQEDFVDGEGNYISISVTDNKTEIDSLIWYTAETGNEIILNNISVYSQYSTNTTLANFEYQGYRYYLFLEFEDIEYLLSIVEQMLNNI